MPKSKHRKIIKKPVPKIGKCLTCGELTAKTNIISHEDKKYSYYLCSKHERTEELKQSIKDMFNYVNDEED